MYALKGSIMNMRTTAVGFVAFTLIVVGISRADFIFSTTSAGIVPYDGAGDNLILTGQPASPVLNFQTAINIQDVEIAAPTPPPNLINNVVPFSFTLGLIQTPGLQPSTPGTDAETVTGFLSITRSDTGGELSSLVSLNIPTISIGNTIYTFSNPSYAAPTVNSAPNSVGAGNLSIDINSGTVVPEPSTLALLALGTIGLLIARRRSAVAGIEIGPNRCMA